MPRTPDYWAGLGWAGLAMGSGRFRLTKSAIGADRLRRCASRPQRPQLPGHHPLEIQQHRPRLQQLIRLLRAQQLGLVAEGVVITALENRAPSPDPHCSCWDPRHRSRGEGIDQNDVVSSKWRALRVASLASCAKAMPAISVSRRSTGRPPAGGGGWHRGDSPHRNAARTPPRSLAIPWQDPPHPANPRQPDVAAAASRRTPRWDPARSRFEQRRCGCLTLPFGNRFLQPYRREGLRNVSTFSR